MIQLIPAIDIIEGHCVRLTQGDYNRQVTYDASPADMVRRYADSGVTRVHIVDLDGAKASSPQNLKVLEQAANVDGVSIEWGGGIKSEGSLRSVFNAGAAYAIVGSAAVKHPDHFRMWLKAFSPEKVILGADIREGKISINGWQEDVAVSIDTLIDGFLEDGLSQVICTDISRDGMLGGPSVELYRRLQQKYEKIDFTVSGGISSMEDIRQLSNEGLRRVIIGKAIYEHRISLSDIERWIVSGQ